MMTPSTTVHAHIARLGSNVTRFTLRLVVLAAVVTAVVLSGVGTSPGDVTSAAAETSTSPAPADYPYPTLSTAGMGDDRVSELLQNGFTGDAPVLADVTTLYGPDQVDVEDMDEWTVGVYFGLGYHSDQADQAERLYAPGTH